MSAPVSPPKLMTTEELLAMPDDGVERWLIRGELREGGMTVRDRWHSHIMARLSFLLYEWLDPQPQPRGRVYCGEVGFRLLQDPDSTVGINLAYIDAEMAANEPAETTLIDGPPLLAVEILSPSERISDLNEKIRDYRQAGVALIWIVDIEHRAITIHRPNHPPTMVNETQELTGEPHLPGFRVPVARIFER